MSFKKKILITGATGFIGNHIINELNDNFNEYKIIAVGRKLKPWNSNFTKKNIKYLDLLKDKISNLGNFECIIHCAALLDISKKIYSWNEFFETNVEIILRLSNEINYKKFILISTGSIFSSDSKNINPNSFYGLSKFIGEKLFEILQEENQRQHFIFRLPIVIGSNSNNNIVDEFVKKMLKNKKIEIYGNGRIKRNIIQANDVARLIFKSCINKKYKGKFKIFNVGSSKSMNIIDIAKLIKKLLNSNSNIININKVRRFDSDSIINIKEIKKVFNFEPKSTSYYIKEHILEKYL